jgi:hypothetical protein
VKCYSRFQSSPQLKGQLVPCEMISELMRKWPVVSKAELFEPIPNFVSNCLALVIAFLPNGRTIASAKREDIYRPERSDQDNQNEKTAHTIKFIDSIFIKVK